MLGPFSKSVHAEYHQFYVQDAEAHDTAMRAGAAVDPDVAPGGWTDDAVKLYRIGPPPRADPDAPGEHFEYVLDLWPSTEPAPLNVLKQGTE
ncbi:hypothetical protein [Cryptosporangium sp. NPDC048952]|uniref:hypothetical protein n=1 Tax=Cryptosporangium sp. NPDC048952 TaxID=3363961 RepID=UPI00372186FF